MVWPGCPNLHGQVDGRETRRQDARQRIVVVHGPGVDGPSRRLVHAVALGQLGHVGVVFGQVLLMLRWLVVKVVVLLLLMVLRWRGRQRRWWLCAV